MELVGLFGFKQLKNVLRVLRDFQIGKALQIESVFKKVLFSAKLRLYRLNR